MQIKALVVIAAVAVVAVAIVYRVKFLRDLVIGTPVST